MTDHAVRAEWASTRKPQAAAAVPASAPVDKDEEATIAQLAEIYDDFGKAHNTYIELGYRAKQAVKAYKMFKVHLKVTEWPSVKKLSLAGLQTTNRREIYTRRLVVGTRWGAIRGHLLSSRLVRHWGRATRI
jgi:hypothetical protein